LIVLYLLILTAPTGSERPHKGNHYTDENACISSMCLLRLVVDLTMNSDVEGDFR
jgi:hypothetical protein